MSAVVLLAPGNAVGPRFDWYFGAPGQTLYSHHLYLWLPSRKFGMRRLMRRWTALGDETPQYDYIGPEIPLEELKALIPEDEIAMALAAAISA